MKNIFFSAALSALLVACAPNAKQATKVVIATVNPGHFHASLVQKVSYPQVSNDVYVYSLPGADLESHLARIEGFNTREQDPTSWNEILYTGDDFLAKMVSDGKANVMVTAGDNSERTKYIKTAVQAGMNVLADKPMVITAQGFEELKECFDLADKKGVLLYDIMTERNEITSILQKELAHIEPIYGNQKEGTAEEPGIEMESVHNFFKMVAGSPLTRPAWFYDLDRQGEAIVDVATHLVDLVQWQLFPEQIINCSDINMISARHWPTPMTPEQFKLSTGLDSYPDFLAGSVKDGVLQVCTNGEMTYSIKGVTARVVALWNFESPNYADTHYCLMRGTKSNLVIRQGEAQGYRPELYIEASDASAEYALKMSEAFASLADKYPGIQLETEDNGIWHVMIPDSYRVGHEAHFGQVTEHFLQYLEDGKLPDWEKPCMISKYYTTTKALEMARQAE